MENFAPREPLFWGAGAFIEEKERVFDMDRTIKTIPAENGELYVISAGQRDTLAKFSGRVEIVEHTNLVPILGEIQKGTKKLKASFIVCGNLDYQREVTDGFIHGGKAYEAVADLYGERLCFSGLRFMDSVRKRYCIIWPALSTTLKQDFPASWGYSG